MKWLLRILLVLIGIVVVVYVVGLCLPSRHTAMMSAVIPAPVDQVWNRITNVADFPRWRKDMTSIQVANDSEWVEVAGRMRVPMRMGERDSLKRAVVVINSSDLPFGGEWVYELQPQGNSTQVTITENGEVRQPFFRFVSAFIMGRTATMRKYLSSLQDSFK